MRSCEVAIIWPEIYLDSRACHNNIVYLKLSLVTSHIEYIFMYMYIYISTTHDKTTTFLEIEHHVSWPPIIPHKKNMPLHQWQSQAKPLSCWVPVHPTSRSWERNAAGVAWRTPRRCWERLVSRFAWLLEFGSLGATFIEYVKFKLKRLLTTVDGRNPKTILGCIKPCKYSNWINYLSISTVQDFFHQPYDTLPCSVFLKKCLSVAIGGSTNTGGNS